MAKVTLTDIAAGYLSIATYNANNTAIEAAIENTLSRDGTAPNTMGANLDLNSNKIVNVTDGANNQDACTVAQLAAASVVSTTSTAALTTLADSGANYAATTVEGAFSELASTAASEGASIIGVEDSAGNMAATNVEAALAEIYTDLGAVSSNLASNANAQGASLVGVEDAAGNWTATDVEATLVEMQAEIDASASTTGSFVATLTGFSADPTTPTVRWNKSLDTVTIIFAFGTFTGTSNATTWTITNLPAALTPNYGQVVPIMGLVDAGSAQPAAGVVLISGTTLTFGLDGTDVNTGGGFTASGNKGFVTGTSTIQYSLFSV